MKLNDIKFLFYKSNRRQLATVSTMVANIALGAAHIVLSLDNLSLFLGFSGAFNIIIALGKYFALERLLRLKHTDEKIKKGAEVKSIDKINNCTLISSFLFFSFGMVVTFFYEDSANYGTGMVIFIASAALVKLVSFIFSAVVTLRKKEGVKYYVKLMTGAAALISLALTQRAVLYYVKAPRASLYSGVGGMFFSLSATFVAMFMIKKAGVQKKYLLRNNMIDEKVRKEILIKQAKRQKLVDKLKGAMTDIKSVFNGKK